MPAWSTKAADLEPGSIYSELTPNPIRQPVKWQIWQHHCVKLWSISCQQWTNECEPAVCDEMWNPISDSIWKFVDNFLKRKCSKILILKLVIALKPLLIRQKIYNKVCRKVLAWSWQATLSVMGHEQSGWWWMLLFYQALTACFSYLCYFFI